jgi:hypothetical protein
MENGLRGNELWGIGPQGNGPRRNDNTGNRTQSKTPHTNSQIRCYGKKTENSRLDDYIKTNH